ncbi:MAG: molecular chaperone HtpG [Coriobacteriaceae bacterium]|nr:molecular chaperone HtpG [Coriobacteriaceae bacterium]MDD7431312.1 molecular chaperone HtpG [Coriobacteriaceae bacterium]MDY4987343.1 molecular chaperone HtpG [Eggerthellaceae bacterium]MDY5371318.1 molecular chaperone HtpG [Eggerthellaceae bacterium]
MQKFKTESKKLLDLMINSIYTNQEIFLRELISNASDAEDKLYFKSLTDQDIQIGKGDLSIRVAFDKEARTITVSDNGIGMDAEELEKNLGTIAHSDSFEFKAAQKQGEDKPANSDEEEVEVEERVQGDVDIIGQFGVGFYSCFMVASHVRVVTKRYGSDQAFAWESDGVEGYTISPAQKEGHGTDVILTIKPNTDADNLDRYLSEYGLKDLIKRYSNYVRYPVVMNCSHQRQLPKPEDAGDDYTPEWEEYFEDETVNSMIPIWKRRKSEVTDEEYNEFYKSQFHDFADPQRVISVHAEGAISYDVLLFIPSRPPYDLYSRDFKRGLELYSSNVLIMDKCEELLPDYFGFVRGIVDSQDLTLNISRETLQHNSQLRAIAKKVEKKIVAELEKMLKNEREEYEKFFENFGRSIKYGIYMSYGTNKDELGKLLMFHSAKENKMVTLDEYIEAMPEEQDAIYYAAGESRGRLANMPIVTTVLERGRDVLLCTQDVDEFCFQTMMDFHEKQLKNVAGADLGLESEADKTAAEQVAKDNEALFDAMKEALGESVTKVAVSTRLSGVPSCITAEGPISLEMEKAFAMMPEAENMKSQRVLELNTDHPVFEVMKAAQDAGDSEKVARYARMLYNQALLVEGMPIEDPVEFAKDIADLMR